MTARILSALSAAALAVPAPAAAQLRMSEAATVSQTVDGTVITVSYSRPQLRGRPPGPDGVFHHEHMWTPGANWATTLEVSRPITLNGHPVAAGKYSVWLETGEKDWTVHLHPEPRLFHTRGPKASEMVLTFTATTERTDQHVEALTFDFPEVRADGATLRFRWAKVVLPFRIEVEPWRRAAAMTEQDAAPYVGSWAVRMMNETGQPMPEMKVEIMLANGSLRGVMDGPAPFGMEFLPQPGGTFLLGFLMEGKLVEVESATPIHFEMKDGRAVRWYAGAVKGIGDKPWIEAVRR